MLSSSVDAAIISINIQHRGLGKAFEHFIALSQRPRSSVIASIGKNITRRIAASENGNSKCVCAEISSRYRGIRGENIVKRGARLETNFAGAQIN